MYKNLKDFRKSLGMNQKAFAESLGLGLSTYNGYETGAREPKSDFWVTVAEKYGVTIDYLMGYTDKPTTVGKTALSNEALSIARRYDALEPDGKGAVRAILDYAESVRDREEAAKTKVVPLFPAASGPGEPAQDEYQETYEIPADSKAVCAVRISGDSMEPHLHNGEVYLVRDKRPAPGDVAVMLVDGAVYCKQYCKDSVGNLYLFSLNRQRKDKDVTVLYGSNSFVKCWGVVECPRTPLPID